MFKKKNQTALRGGSSAFLVSVIVHVVLFVVAGAFVAVEVIERKEAKFEAKQIKRPKMKIKKLQVPVKVQKKMKRAPKLSKRVTVTPRVKTKSVDFKMPEMTGFGKGTGVDVGGSGFGGSLGFASTQLNVFGLKSSGEKIVFLLDTSRNILVDQIGGIDAYAIIKKELLNLIESLPPTALFNVIIFDRSACKAFSKDLSQANDENIKKIKAWLEPLNAAPNRIGFKTLPNQGTKLTFEGAIPVMNSQRGWACGLSYCMQKGVESLYWLGNDDWMEEIHKDYYSDAKQGKPLKHETGWPPGSRKWDVDNYPGGKENWLAKVEEAQKKLDAENKSRRARGEKDKIIGAHGGPYSLVRSMLPGTQLPTRLDQDKVYKYTGRDVVSYIQAMQKKYSSKDKRSASIGLKRKKIDINVIHFVPKTESETTKIKPFDRLRTVAQKFGGKYLQIQGLDAIRSSASSQ